MGDGKIKIGAHQLSWGTSLPQEIMFQRAEQVRKLGCGAFEVFLSGQIAPPSIIKEATKKAGLIPIGCAIIRDGIDGDPLSTDEVIRVQAVKAIEQYITVVHDMGSTLLVGPLANILAKPGARPPTDEELEAGVETFRNIARFANSKGVKVAIEPLQWSEISWPNTVEDVLTSIDNAEATGDVPKHTLGVLFDIYHANRMEENWQRALEVVLQTKKLFHVHVAGPNRTPPQVNQHIDWWTMVRILKKANWDGIMTIESFGAECDLPYEVVGPGERLPAKEVIALGRVTFQSVGLSC